MQALKFNSRSRWGPGVLLIPAIFSTFAFLSSIVLEVFRLSPEVQIETKYRNKSKFSDSIWIDDLSIEFKYWAGAVNWMPMREWRLEIVDNEGGDFIAKLLPAIKVVDLDGYSNGKTVKVNVWFLSLPFHCVVLPSLLLALIARRLLRNKHPVSVSDLNA